jgi:hypothetical protein
MSDTTESVSDMRERIEADKRSIFEIVINADLINTPGSAAQSDSLRSNKNYKTLSDDDYALLCTDDDVDDAEELFKQILKKAEIAYKQDKEFK